LGAAIKSSTGTPISNLRKPCHLESATAFKVLFFPWKKVEAIFKVERAGSLKDGNISRCPSRFLV